MYLEKLPTELRVIRCEKIISTLHYGICKNNEDDRKYFVSYSPDYSDLFTDVAWEWARYVIQFVGRNIEECAQQMYNYLVEKQYITEYGCH